jgi:hypothetical protein
MMEHNTCSFPLSGGSIPAPTLSSSSSPSSIPIPAARWYSFRVSGCGWMVR